MSEPLAVASERPPPVQNARLTLVHPFLAMTEDQQENGDAAREQMESAWALLVAHVDHSTTYDSELEWWIFAREALNEAKGVVAAE